MTDDRYQYQTRFVKACRWLRWRPWFAFLGAWRLIRWAAAGAHPIGLEPDDDFSGWQETRLETATTIWQVTRAEADIKMCHYFTCEEVLADLRSTPPESP